MKKKKKRWGCYVWWGLALFSALCIPEGFRDSTGMGIFFIFLALGFGLLGYGSFANSKKSAAKARGKRVAELREKTAADKAREEARLEAEEKRKAFMQSKVREFVTNLRAIPQVEIEVSPTRVKRQPVSELGEIHFTNITRSTVIDNLFPLVVIDTETTGLRPAGNDIIEVSAIRLEKGFRPVSCFTTLLKPRQPIPEEATRVNNITDDMVQDKPSFSQIAESFSSYIADCNIVGHNLGFDLKFIYACGATLPEKKRFYDTQALAEKTLTSPRSKVWDNDAKEYYTVSSYDVENYKLTTLCDHYHIYRPNAHRSLSDSYATALLFEHLIEDKTGRA